MYRLLEEAGIDVVIIDSDDVGELKQALHSASAMWVRAPERVTAAVLDAGKQLVAVPGYDCNDPKPSRVDCRSHHPVGLSVPATLHPLYELWRWQTREGLLTMFGKRHPPGYRGIERRAALSREPVDIPAEILVPGSAPIECRIVDLSDTGARLSLESIRACLMSLSCGLTGKPEG